MIIQNNNLLNPSLTLSNNFPGISYYGAILTLQIKNKDNIVKLLQEKSFEFLNKLINLFHSCGISYFGEPINEGESIIFREDRGLFHKNIMIYSHLISDNKFTDIDDDDDPFDDDINAKQKLRNLLYLDQSSTIAVICGLEFIFQYVRDFPIESNVMKNLDLKINLGVQRGFFFQGYTQSETKIFSMIISNKLTQTRDMLKKFPFFEIPSLYVFQDSYELLPRSLRANLYPIELAYFRKEGTEKIYKQYLNHCYLSWISNQNKFNFYKDFNPGDIRLKRKIFETYLIDNNGRLENYIESSGLKALVKSFQVQIKFILYYTMKLIENQELNECKRPLLDLFDLSISCHDSSLIYHIKFLIELVNYSLENNLELSYTKSDGAEED